MSLVSKDSIIQACADAYKEGAGVESVKVGELAAGILAAISAGGGSLPEGWAMGEFSTTEETMSGNFLIEHGLGAIPNVVLIYKKSAEARTYSIRGVLRVQTGEEYDEEYGYYPYSSNAYSLYDTAVGIGSSTTSPDFDDNRETFCVPSCGSNRRYFPADDYCWLAIKLEV